MNQPEQPELIPTQRTVATITVAGADMATTEKHLRDIGAVLLGFSVKGGTYKLNLIVPYGVDTSTSATVGCACDICQLPHEP